MLADIGLIGAIYTFIRLLQSLTERSRPGYHPIIAAITILGLLAIALLGADILLISADLGATATGF